MAGSKRPRCGFSSRAANPRRRQLLMPEDCIRLRPRLRPLLRRPRLLRRPPPAPSPPPPPKPCVPCTFPGCPQSLLNWGPGAQAFSTGQMQCRTSVTHLCADWVATGVLPPGNMSCHLREARCTSLCTLQSRHHLRDSAGGAPGHPEGWGSTLNRPAGPRPPACDPQHACSPLSNRSGQLGLPELAGWRAGALFESKTT